MLVPGRWWHELLGAPIDDDPHADIPSTARCTCGETKAPPLLMILRPEEAYGRTPVGISLVARAWELPLSLATRLTCLLAEGSRYRLCCQLGAAGSCEGFGSLAEQPRP